MNAGDDWEFVEMARLRELLREIGIEVWFSPDGLMVQNTRLESVLHLDSLEVAP